MESRIKRIVCLANSRKIGGRCIAGKEITPSGTPGGWVRPTGAGKAGAVLYSERQYRGGGDPRTLDIVDVPVLEPEPSRFQRENWGIDPERRWSRVRTLDWGDLDNFVDCAATLWINGNSTANGLNDQIPISTANRLNSSLLLIWVDRLELSVSLHRTDHGNWRRRVQGSFSYNGTGYRLWVTDPVIENRYKLGPIGGHEIRECFLTISLGEPFRGHVYKLIAAVIERQRGDC